LLILALVPIDRLFELLGRNKSIEQPCRQAIPIPVVAVLRLQTELHRRAQLGQDLGNDPICIDILFEPLHIAPSPAHARFASAEVNMAPFDAHYPDMTVRSDFNLR